MSTVDEAINLVIKSKKLHAKGGLTLYKFAPNSMKVLHPVGAEDRTKKVVDLRHGNHVIERALGINWCIETASSSESH